LSSSATADTHICLLCDLSWLCRLTWEYHEASIWAFGICFYGPLMCLGWNFRITVLYRFAGDTAELGIIRARTVVKVKVILNPRVHLVRDLS